MIQAASYVGGRVHLYPPPERERDYWRHLQRSLDDYTEGSWRSRTEPEIVSVAVDLSAALPPLHEKSESQLRLRYDSSKRAYIRPTLDSTADGYDPAAMSDDERDAFLERDIAPVCVTFSRLNIGPDVRSEFIGHYLRIGDFISFATGKSGAASLDLVHLPYRHADGTDFYRTADSATPTVTQPIRPPSMTAEQREQCFATLAHFLRACATQAELSAKCGS